jgi:hypothetical protein
MIQTPSREVFMRILTTVFVTLSLSLTASAGTCPDPIEMFQKVQMDGGLTSSEDLADSCTSSMEVLNSCRQKGMDEYNRRMAISVQQQCESGFMKVENFRNKNFKKKIMAPYVNLKYNCELNNRHNETAAALCKADAAKLINLYFNLNDI